MKNWRKKDSLWLPKLGNEKGFITILTGGVPVAGFDKTSLISWWSLDEESGTRNDSHGTNHLTDVNTVEYASGKKSNAARFVSSNAERLSCDSNTTLQMGQEQDFSLLAWVYFDSLSVVHVMAKPGEYYLYTPNNGSFYFYNEVNEAAVAIPGGILSSTWYFIVGWYDAVNNRIGILVNNTYGQELSSAGRAVGTNALSLGGNTTWGGYLTGRIDEAAILKRLLTNDEKTWLYNDGAGRAYSEL